MDLGIAGRVAVVSGGSKGQGLSVAQVLLAEGCKVLIAARTPETLEAARAQLEALDPPRLREEARRRGARLVLPGDEGVDPLLDVLPYPVALWVRGTLPRVRYDQLMALGWKVFLPVSLVYLVAVAGVMEYFGWFPHA